MHGLYCMPYHLGRVVAMSVLMYMYVRYIHMYVCMYAYVRTCTCGTYVCACVCGVCV